MQHIGDELVDTKRKIKLLNYTALDLMIISPLLHR